MNQNHVMVEQYQILFIIEAGGLYVGHVGSFRFDFEDSSCGIGNILSGRRNLSGIMKCTIATMVECIQAPAGYSGESERYDVIMRLASAGTT